MDRDRVVMVGAGAAAGSGYVVGPRLVLTSAHVVGPVGTGVQLLHPGRAPVYRAAVVWSGTPGGSDDAALVQVDDPGWQAPAGRAEPWGRLGTWTPRQPCQTWGVPKVSEIVSTGVPERPATPELKQLSGWIDPGSGLVHNRLVMALEQTPPTWTPTTRAGSPWSGLSGAALLCGGLVVGVMADDPAHSAYGTLEAVRVSVLHRDVSFRTALTTYGADSTVLETDTYREVAAPSAVLPPGPGRAPLAPAALLDPDRQVVGFHGRRELLRRLTTWCTQDGPGAWLVHGPGGQGKTRLAHQVRNELERTPWHGPYGPPLPWRVLWPLFEARPEDLDGLRHAVDPLLVVLDMAEIRVPQLDALLNAAVDPHRAAPFKILLLARSDGEWWHSVRRGPQTGKHLLADAEVTDLPPLFPHPAAREDVYREAVRSFAAALSAVVPQPRHDWAELAAVLQPPVLRGGDWSNVLTLHMTALADLLDAVSERDRPAGSEDRQSPDAADRQPLDAEDRLLEHQRWYWDQSAAAHGLDPLLFPDGRQDAMALAVLVEPTDDDQAVALLARLPALEEAAHPVRLQAARWIGAQCPGAPGRPWGALQPDRLAERFAGRRLLSHPRLATAVIDSPDLTDAQAARLLAVLARAAAHPPLREPLSPVVTRTCRAVLPQLALPAMDAALMVEDPAPLLAALSAYAAEPRTAVTELERLADHIPHSTYHLSEFGVHLLERITELRTGAEDTGGGSAAPLALRVRRRLRPRAAVREQHDRNRRTLELARRLRQLAKSQSEVGLRAEGLTSARRAVALLRPLAGTGGPEGAAVELAAALNNLASCLIDLEMRAEALAEADEGVRIGRAVADAEGSVPVDLSLHGPRTRLARLLQTLAVAESALGRPEQAATTSAAAVRILRELVDLGAEEADDLLARNLANLSNYLSGQGRYAEALESVEEAVRITERLAEDRPDAFRVNLASCTGVHSQRLAELGRVEESLAEARRSLAMRRRLARERPRAHGHALVNGLNSLAMQLGNTGLHEEEGTTYREAAELCEQLTSEEPGLFRDLQAMVLNNQAQQLKESGDAEGAIAAARKAVDLYHTLEAEHPTAHRADIAMSLGVLAGTLAAGGYQEESLAGHLAAADAFRSLAAGGSVAAKERLAQCLNNLAIQQDCAGYGEEALATVREAIALQQPLAQELPDAHLPNLSLYTMHEAVCLHKLGRSTESVAALRRATDLDEELTARSPARYAGQLADRLVLLGGLATAANLRPQALSALDRALTIRRNRAEADGVDHDPRRAQLLDAHASNLLGGARFEESVTATEETVVIRRGLVTRSDSPANRLELAWALTTLGLRRFSAGLRVEALAPLEEAAHGLRQLARQPGAAEEAVQGIARTPESSSFVSLAWGQESMTGALGTALLMAAPAQMCLGRETAARAAAEEAVAAFERLPPTHALRALHHATAMGALGVIRSETGDPADGLPDLDRAVELVRPAARDGDVAARQALGHQLTASGGLLRRIPGRLPEATARLEEAVAIATRLTEEDTTPHEPDLLRARAELGIALARSGRRDEALRLTREVVARTRTLTASAATARALDLGTALHAFASARLRTGTQHATAEHTEAVARARESVDLLYRLAEREPGLLLRTLPEATQTLHDLDVQRR
ncbi:hypothetical protein ACFVW2_33250 [Streptomyces sp. NPDC058171]